MKKWILLLFLGLTLFQITAKADVALVIMEAVGVAGEYTGSGHSAVYFSGICSDDAISLRLCRAEEMGVVISSYPGFVAGSNYEWMAVPITQFLYGVSEANDIPLYANGKIRTFLRDNFRKTHLHGLMADGTDGSIPDGSWKIVLTAAFNRDIYSFAVRTTKEDDTAFLNDFTKIPNIGRFNSVKNNCADFAGRILNRYFPGSAKRDWINDFGISTPKALARSFNNYAKKHPKLELSITRFPQVQGPIWRSFDNRNFTEMAFKSKKYLIPSLIFKPTLVPMFAGVYYLTGRFDVHRTYAKYASAEVARLKLANKTNRDPRITFFTASTAEGAEKRAARERLALVGDKASWEAHKRTFAPIIKNAIDHGIFQDEKEVRSFFRDLELQSHPELDADGQLILKVKYYGEDRELGLTSRNLLVESSDRELALKLILAKIYADLKADGKNRSLYREFWINWLWMRELLKDQAQLMTNINRKRGRFLQENPPTDVGRGLKKLVIAVTH